MSHSEYEARPVPNKHQLCSRPIIIEDNNKIVDVYGARVLTQPINFSE